MKVIECNLYGIIPEEVVSSDLVKFVEENLDRTSFKIKSVPENIDPAIIQEGVIGFCSLYGIPYLSNPKQKIGIGGIDCFNKRIVFASNESAFFEQRDAIVFAGTSNLYIRENYQQVVEEFQIQGYSFFEFAPEHRISMNTIRNIADLKIGRELKLEEII